MTQQTAGAGSDARCGCRAPRTHTVTGLTAGDMVTWYMVCMCMHTHARADAPTLTLTHSDPTYSYTYTYTTIEIEGLRRCTPWVPCAPLGR